MIIQFDTAHKLHADEAFKAPLIVILKDKLDEFDHQVSRLEVHLTDENGNKDGPNDKRCLLEAHLPGMLHVVVTDHSHSYEQAVDRASDKMVASLHSIHERSERSHRVPKQEDSI